MGRERSLTSSERTALYFLRILQKMLLVPSDPYHYEKIGKIRRVGVNRPEEDLRKGITSGTIYDVQERTVVFGWGKKGSHSSWCSVAITLQKELGCLDEQELSALTDDKGGWWIATHIEIRGHPSYSNICQISINKEDEGVITFSNNAVVRLVLENLPKGHAGWPLLQ